MTPVSIRISTATRKNLEDTLRQAFKAGDLSLVKRVGALLGIGRGEPVGAVAGGVGVSASAVYAWLRAFLLEGVAGLRVQWKGGRPPKLTPTQRQQLAAIVRAGPEAAGFPTGCWHALLIQQVLWREFGVTYNVQYLATLLHNLGFSFQKARFVSDHRTRWPAPPGWRLPGRRGARKPRRPAGCSCSGTRPASRNGGRWATPGPPWASNRWSRPRGAAKPTRSSG
jgi:transposase